MHTSSSSLASYHHDDNFIVAQIHQDFDEQIYIQEYHNILTRVSIQNGFAFTKMRITRFYKATDYWL